jgi:hypothetical protein
MSELVDQLRHLGLRATAAQLSDFVARATKDRWGPAQILENVAVIEEQDRARRSLERRLSRSRLGRFKPMADFDWAWPAKIDRDRVEAVLRLEFLSEARNVIDRRHRDARRSRSCLGGGERARVRARITRASS